MTGSLSIERYRELVRDLRARIDARVRAEQEWAAFETEGADPPLHELEQALRAVSESFDRDRAEIDQRTAAGREDIEQRYQGEIAAAEAEYGRSVGQIQQGYDAELARAESQYEENHWMLSSLLDDQSENSPKRQYETLKAQLQQSRERQVAQWDDLKRMYDEAVERVERRRQRIGSQPDPPPVPAGREEAFSRFDAAEVAVRAQSDRLQRQLLPRLFGGGAFVLLGLFLWLAACAAAYFLVDPAWLGQGDVRPVVWALMSGGMGLGVCTLVLLTLYMIAARQTAAVFEPLQQNVADAHACHQRWLRFAKEELQRRERDYRARYAAIVEHRERSLEQFESARAERAAQLDAQREQGLHDASQRRQTILRDAAERRDRDVQSVEAAYQQEMGQRQAEFEQERSRLSQDHDRRTAEREAERRRLWEQLTEQWTAGLQRLQAAVAALRREGDRLFPEWSEIVGPAWEPPTEIPSGLRIGDYELDLNRIPQGLEHSAEACSSSQQPGCSEAAGLLPTRFLLPAVLPFPESPSLVVHAQGPGRAEAVSILQTAMLRLLTLLPPGKVRFTLFDPVGLGENFAAFMHLADFDDLLISSRIWTETAHIEQQLANLTEHMENVFQKYLRNEFESIEEYNIHAGEVAEPYRILVVANFPAGFSERAAQRLVSIATSGARCGVYTLLSVDTRQPLPRGFELANLEAGATVLQWQDGHFVTRLIGPEPLPLRIDAPPEPSVFAALVRKAGELSKDIRRVEVPFHRIAPTEDRYWTRDSRKLVEVPLGRAGATKLQHLRLGVGTSQHVLVAGKTGSGKSTLLHVLITNLALHYSPDDIQFYLIDFKKGVEFKTYATHALPHAQVIAIESDREFGVSALQRLDAILKERGDLFRQEGVQDIGQFRDARPDQPMPRILLVVDEFQEFFVEDDRDAQTASLLLDRLVRQGRAFGIHVLLGSQTLGGAYSLARTTVGQMAVRVALQCSETDAHLILSEDNAAARLLTRPGEAIYNDANGMLEGNSPFQISWLGDDEKDDYLDRLRELARDRGLPPAAPVVFEGNIPADPSRNAELMRRIAAPHATMPGEPLTAWLGEAVAITGPTHITFRRQSGSNLLIVGQSPAAALGMLSACLVAFAAETEWGRFPTCPADLPGRLETCPTKPFLLLTSNATESGRLDRWQRIIDALPRPVRIVGPDDAAPVIAELAAEVGRRQQGGAAAPVFLLIDDLSRFRDLKRSDDDFGFGGFGGGEEEPASPGQQFAEILREGPAVGVHALVWCDSYNNVDRFLGRQLVREFEPRACFQMSAADSSNLIDSPAASRLGANRALLYLDERGTTEKFRPYGPPSDEWLARLRGRLPSEAPPEPPADEPQDLAVADDIDAWTVL